MEVEVADEAESLMLVGVGVVAAGGGSWGVDKPLCYKPGGAQWLILECFCTS